VVRDLYILYVRKNWGGNLTQSMQVWNFITSVLSVNQLLPPLVYQTQSAVSLTDEWGTINWLADLFSQIFTPPVCRTVQQTCLSHVLLGVVGFWSMYIAQVEKNRKPHIFNQVYISFTVGIIYDDFIMVMIRNTYMKMMPLLILFDSTQKSNQNLSSNF
jgi:hypothetical protein